MNVALWIVAGFLAFAFGVGGAMKVVVPKDKLATNQFAGWVDDWSVSWVKALGVVEMLAAAGLVLAPLLDILPVLAPLAAAGLVLLMIGALAVHVPRHEGRNVSANLVYLSLAAFVAWGRFGPYPFSG